LLDLLQLTPKTTGRTGYEHKYSAARPSPPYDCDEWTLTTRFDRFGAGEKRRPDFAVTVSWKEVENIHRCAVRRRMPGSSRLARGDKARVGGEGLGWQAPEPRSTAQASAACWGNVPSYDRDRFR